MTTTLFLSIRDLMGVFAFFYFLIGFVIFCITISLNIKWKMRLYFVVSVCGRISLLCLGIIAFSTIFIDLGVVALPAIVGLVCIDYLTCTPVWNDAVRRYRGIKKNPKWPLE